MVRVVRRPGGADPPVPRLRAGAAAAAGPVRRPVLACGAELKNTFCLARDGHAFISHHIGDLENVETLRSFTEGIEHFGRLFDITPEVIAHDLHPEYLSTKYALDLADGRGRRLGCVGVQHHHAHIAVLPGRQRRGRAGHRGGLRRHRLRHRRHHLGRRVPDRRPGRRRARAGTWRRCRCPAARPRSGSRGGWPRRTSTPRIRRRAAAGLDVARRNQRALGRGARDGRSRHQRPGHLQRGPAVRRGRGAARRAGRDQLRGPGRDRARAAGRPGRDVAPTRLAWTAGDGDGAGPLLVARRDLVRAVADDLAAGTAHGR